MVPATRHQTKNKKILDYLDALDEEVVDSRRTQPPTAEEAVAAPAAAPCEAFTMPSPTLELTRFLSSKVRNACHDDVTVACAFELTSYCASTVRTLFQRELTPACAVSLTPNCASTARTLPRASSNGLESCFSFAKVLALFAATSPASPMDLAASPAPSSRLDTRTAPAAAATATTGACSTRSVAPPATAAADRACCFHLDLGEVSSGGEL
mmetsp:Transcript_62004/g.200921  ORF Transcript_62004/g.200921 Transcript_62004/m.200921 type:complete len:211 (+) Transcript_62004:45-677(+)